MKLDMAGNVSSSSNKSSNLPPEKKLRLQKADGVSVSGSILETENPVNHNSNKRTFDQVSPKRHTETKDSFVQVAMDPYVRVREIEGIHYCYRNAIGKLDSIEQSSINPKDSGVVQRNIQTGVGNEKSQNSETMRLSEIRGQFNDVDKAVEALLKQEDHAIENEPQLKTSNSNNSEASPGSSNESVLVGIFMLSEVKGLVDENTSLRDERLCKVCMERDASLTFIPCGHLVTCYNCFLSLDNCPICKQNIGSAIRTYMS
ncbi:BOI-related E3 ubiquitin-protein ligase 2 isoform X2 [Biomphalaria glabrata]|nr:putative BOI-related E3 ubiquitin-protein ligase 2 isoform X2 [Biomphalaria glabrata]KAI8750562.1 BOI-related E3 ubiquitin-protein ligase 2 isoform X2 [Biomphalaria glabrata]